MKRAKNVHFIPNAQPFSRFETNEDGELAGFETALGAEDVSNLAMEQMLLSMLAALNNDKERCVLLLQVLREYGYNLDHASSAKALGVQWRWYMRVKKSVREKLSSLAI